MLKGSLMAIPIAVLSCTPLLARQLTPVNDPPPPPTSQLTPEMRGDIYMARKMYRDAIDMYRQAPQTPATLNKIGISFQQMSRLDLAQKYYLRAIKLDPQFAQAINNFGTVLYAEGRYSRAIVYYKRSLRYAGPGASICVNLGMAYFARMHYKKASEYFEQALQLDPEVLERRDTFGTLMQDRTTADLALFHLYLAKAYAKRGSVDLAIIYLRKALEEGLTDRKKLPEMPEFASLRQQPAFQDLIAQNPKPL